jgi:uncharacterized protein YndB with AHSA1/START domain
MTHTRMEIHIEAPVEEVWKFYCDPANWPDFMPRATFSDFSGPIDEVGTTYVGGMRMMGYEMSTTYEIVEVEPERLLHERSEWQENRFHFKPDGDETDLVVESDWEMPGKVPGFIKDMVSKGWGERNFRNALADMKALVEAKVPVHA